jgi:hypothetical protein
MDRASRRVPAMATGVRLLPAIHVRVYRAGDSCQRGIVAGRNCNHLGGRGFHTRCGEPSGMVQVMAADLVHTDWMLVATLAAPVVALFVGAGLNRLIERRPNVVAYFAHSSAFKVGGENPLRVHTHAMVIRNAGKQPAHNVRVSHWFLPDFNVFPDVDHDVHDLPNGGREIVFPILRPTEQITISYLYFPPRVVTEIHSGIRHDQGFATEVRVLPTPELAPWALHLARGLIILGFVALLYILVVAMRFVAGRGA